MALRFIKPWKLELPDRERAKDRRQRTALANEIERFRKAVPAFKRRQALGPPTQQDVARGFGEAAIEGQFGPFREEDILRIGGRGAARFKEQLTTDPLPQPPRGALAEDTAIAQQQAFSIPVGRQAIPDPVAVQRAKDVLRVRAALSEFDMSPTDFREAVQAGQLRQQGNELASYMIPRPQREKYNKVVQKLGVEGTPILAQGLVPETKQHQLESDARDQGLDPDTLFIEASAVFWDQLFAIEQQEIARRTRPKIEKALKIAKVPNAGAIVTALSPALGFALTQTGTIDPPKLIDFPAPEATAKIVAEVGVPSSIAPLGRFGQAGRLTRMTARGITEGTLNVMQDKAGRADRGEPAATPIEAAAMFAAGAILGATAPELIGALGRMIRGKIVAKTAQGIPKEKAIVSAVAEVTDEGGVVRQDILQQLSRDPKLAQEAVRRRAAIIDAELEGRAEFAEPEAPVRAEPEVAAPAQAAEPAPAPARGVPEGPRQQNFQQFLTERGTPNLDVLDEGILSPSGRVSGPSRRAAAAREQTRLTALGEARREFQGLVDSGAVVDPTGRAVSRPSAEPQYLVEARRIRQQADELRGLAARGMRTRAHLREAENLERQASELERVAPVEPAAAVPSRASVEAPQARPAQPTAPAGEINLRRDVKIVRRETTPGAGNKIATVEVRGQRVSVRTRGARDGSNINDFGDRYPIEETRVLEIKKKAVEKLAAEPAAAAAPAPTVKTRTLFGEEVDTFATERELGGIREQQGGLRFGEEAPVSPEFAAVQERVAVASRARREAADEFRVGRMSEDEFVRIRKLDEQASREFDEAFAREQGRGKAPGNIPQNTLEGIVEERRLAQGVLDSGKRVPGGVARLRTQIAALTEEERIIRDFVERNLTPQQQADELAELQLDFAERDLRTVRGIGGRSFAFGTAERAEADFAARGRASARKRPLPAEAGEGGALDNLAERLNLPEPTRVGPPTKEQLILGEQSPGTRSTEGVVTSADFDVPQVRGGAGSPSLMEAGSPINIDLWRSVERGKITSDLAGDFWRRVGERLSNVTGVGRALKLAAGPQVIGRADPATRAGLTYHTIWTIQDGERLVRMTRLRELLPKHWKGGTNAGEVTINDRSVAMGDLGQAWLRGDTDTIRNMIGRDVLEDELAYFQEAQDYMRTLTEQWGAQTGNVHHAGDTVWPRFVTKEDGSVRIRRPVGAKQSPTKVRVFEMMEEGIRAEVPYTDPLQTLDLFGRAFQKMTRDDILAKVVIEDDVGRIIDPMGLLDPDLVATTNAVRVKYRDASRARRAVQNERKLTATQQREAITAARMRVARAQGSFQGTPEVRRAQARLAALEAEQARLSSLRVERKEARQQFQARLAEATAAEKQAGREWKAQRRKHTQAYHDAQSRALTGRRGERSGITLGPGLSRIIFPEANLKVLENMLGPSNQVMQSISRVAAIPRLTQAGLLDMGQGGIQMATVFFRRPQNWARGMGAGFREVFSPGSFQRSVAESPIAREAIAHDVQVVGSFEPVEAIVGGGILEKAGGTRVGKVVTALARAFDASIGTTKVWEYDALARISRKAGESPDELFRIGSYINTKLGTTNTREMGLSATQRSAESGIGFFSPRYTRSIPGFLAWTMSNGIPAKDARESLFLLMLGGAGTFYGLARASGLSHDETVHRLDPRSRGQFLSIPVFGNEVGFGSAWRSYIKLMGDMARLDSWPTDSWDNAALNNPIARFLRSRSSPVTGTLIDFLTGEDFIGREVSIQGFIDDPALMLDYASESLLPFGLDSMMEARGGLKGRLATFAAEFVGGRAFPESSFVRFERAQEDEFKRRKRGGEFSDFDSYEDLRASNNAAANEIDASSAVVAAQQELDESQERRRETDKGRFFDAREQVLDEFRVEQDRDDQNLSSFFASAGEAGLDPQRYRELQSERLRDSFQRREQIKVDFAIEFERETGKAPTGSVNAAVEEFFSVDAARFTDPVTRDIDPAFYDVRDRAFAGLSPADRDSAFAIINKNRTPIQRDLENLRRQPFDQDGTSLDDYYSIPSDDREKRDRWRRRNPKGDAILFVTGSVGTLIRSASQREANDLVRRIFGSQAEVPREFLRGRTRSRERLEERRTGGGVTFSGGRTETLDIRPRPTIASAASVREKLLGR